MGTELFSTSKTAQILDVSTATLKRWYKWFENENYPKPKGLILPTYERDNRGTRFFTMDAIEQLRDFKEKLQGEYRGCMSKYNAEHMWGKRGKKSLKDGKEAKNEQMQAD